MRRSVAEGRCRRHGVAARKGPRESPNARSSLSCVSERAFTFERGAKFSNEEARFVISHFCHYSQYASF